MGCGGSVDGVSTGGEESATAAVSPAPTPTAKPARASLSAEYAARGEYPVGVREVWFHDPDRRSTAGTRNTHPRTTSERCPR